MAKPEATFYVDDLKSIEVLAADHVDWLLNIMQPIIKRIAVTEFVHGYKHGIKDKESQNGPNPA